MGQTKFVYVTYIRSTRERCGRRLQSRSSPGNTGPAQRRGPTGRKVRPGLPIPPDGRLWDTGKILEADRPRKLMLSWRNEHFAEMKAGGHTTLTYVLEEDRMGVKLTLTHEIAVENSKIIGATSQGWPAVLASLKTMLETGTPLEGSGDWPKDL